jgi:hypothetical protein
MTPFPRTLLTEVHRNLSRRLVRILLLLGVIACAAAGIIAWLANDDGPNQFEAERAVVVSDDLDPTPWAIDLVELWPENGADPVLGIAVIPLVMGALVAGASMVGAEWRAGTVTTNLTWEPRRVRLAVAKFAATGLCAAVIGLLFIVLFALALLPTIAAHGSFEGADADWWLQAVAAVGRGAVLIGAVAIAGAALAMIGRNTAAAIGVAFVLVSILDPILRSWKPRLDRWLVTSNAAWAMSANEGFDASGAAYDPVRGGVIATIYLVALAAAAVYLFRSRDIAATG